MQPEEVVLYAIAAYAVIGGLFAIPYVFFLVSRVDEGASGRNLSNLVFRLMILPGSIALWPFLVWRLLKRNRVPT